MKTNIYAVFDSKAGVHMSPWLATNHGVASRSFGDQVMNPESPFNRHPDDFILFCLGTFDMVTGAMENFPRAENLGPASQWRQELPTRRG